MSEPEPRVVFRATSIVEADVVRALLEAQGMHVLLSADGPQAIFPQSVSGLGEVRLAVCAGDAEKATLLIAEFRQQVSDQLIRIKDEFRALEETLGYHFVDQGLLEHALTHRSKAHEDMSGGVRDNESLEFLGDAVLGFVVAARLFREFPDWNEGQKSKAKAMIVSGAALAKFGESLGLGDHLMLGRGEEKTGGRRKHSLIEDTFEAVIAAIYLDGGIGAAETFLERFLRPQLDDLRAEGLKSGVAADHKSALQAFLQARDMGLPDYRLVAEHGPAHQKIFETAVYAGERALARASGRSKKEAEQRAAEQALRVLAEEANGA